MLANAKLRWHRKCRKRTVSVSKQSVVGENQLLEITFSNAFVHCLNLLQSRKYLNPVSEVDHRTSSRASKERRGPISAAMSKNVANQKNVAKSKKSYAHNFFETAATLLNSRCVCLESWLLQNMSIST